MLLLASLLLAQSGLFKTVVPNATGQNGYEEYLRAAEILQTPEALVYELWEPGSAPPSGGVAFEKGEPVEGAENPALIALWRRLSGMTPLEVRREELSKFGRALDLVRVGNEKGASDPRSDLGPETLFPEFAAFKAIARFAARASGVYAADGRTDRATAVLLDELECADNVGRGTIIANLVGVADSSIALAVFGDLIPRLSRADAVRVQRTVDALLARPPAARSVASGESAFMKSGLRQAFAARETGPVFVSGEDTPDPRSQAFDREFAALSRSGRADLLRRIEARLDARTAAFDHVLAGPERDWVSGLAAVADEDEEPTDLESAFLDLVTPGNVGFVTVAVRNRTQLRLLGLHARLVQYRWDFGHYPDAIDVADPLTGEKYLYERHADGTIRLASKGLPSTGEIELKYKRPPAPAETGAKP